MTDDKTELLTAGAFGPMGEHRVVMATLRDATANPGPLGLMAFGMTTVLLNIHNAGIFEMNTMILAMGVFYGGIAQVIAGIMEWKKNSTFGMTAFLSYGLFWLTLVGLIAFPKWMGIDAPSESAMAWYLVSWGVFTGLMFVATLRINRSLQTVFLSLTILFALLAFRDFAGGAAGEVAEGEQGEQNGQREEGSLQGAIDAQGGHEHQAGEDAPGDQIPSHCRLARCVDAHPFWEGDEAHQGQPEEPVAQECRHAEGAVLLPLHDPRYDLCDAAVEDSHGEDHGVHLEDAGVVDVQQDGGHAERHETQRAWVGGRIAQGGHHDAVLAHRPERPGSQQLRLVVSHLSKPPLSVDGSERMNARLEPPSRPQDKPAELYHEQRPRPSKRRCPNGAPQCCARTTAANAPSATAPGARHRRRSTPAAVRRRPRARPSVHVPSDMYTALDAKRPDRGENTQSD